MKHNLGIFLLSGLIMAAVVGSTVYWDFPTTVNQGQRDHEATNSVGEQDSAYIRVASSTAEAAEVAFAKLQISPLQINAATHTTVTAVVYVPDPNLITSSLILQKVNDTGAVVASLGQMRDDGKGGDLTSGDRRFTLEVTFNEPQEGNIRLRVSGAFIGMLQRLFSTTEILIVRAFVADTGPEELMAQAAAAFSSAQTIEEILPFVDPRLESSLRGMVAEGIPLSEVGSTLASARLGWKTAIVAVFNATIQTGSNESFGISIALEKFPEGWKIVSF